MPSAGVLHILDSTSNKPRPLTLASGVLSVNDSNARSSLASMNSKITSCDTSGLADSVTQSSISSSLSSLDTKITSCDTSALADAVTQSSISSSLSNIDTTLSGTVSVSDGNAQVTLSSIETALTGTLSTTTTLSVSKSATTISNAQSVVSGDFSSSSHDCSSQREVVITGTTTDTSNNIEVHVSDDNSTFYKYGQNSMYPASDGSFGQHFHAPFKYIKLKYTGSGTVTALVMGSD
jgi:hypothetical protein